MQNPQDVQLAVLTMKKYDFFRKLQRQHGGCAIVLGTGLSSLLDQLEIQFDEIPFAEIPYFPTSGVASHKGVFAFGMKNNLPVLIQCGRCHLYEGKTPAEVTFGIRLMASLGFRQLIITNAAGALNPLFDAGQLMLICDIINHTGASPLTGSNCAAWGERFPDRSQPFSPQLNALALQCALQHGIVLQKGVYIGVHGPEMETPAETRMYRQWGADAVGMSTALEVIAANHMNMECLGISCLTNKNLPDCMRPAPFDEVVAQAEVCGKELALLLKAILNAVAEK